jgi:hypothetical protein
MAESQDDSNELTWLEISALESAGRDREGIRRPGNRWDSAKEHEITDLIESALRKLKNRFHQRHPSALLRPDDG